MEENQQIADTESAMADINLQETIRIPQEEEEQNDVFHDSLTEAQWQQRLNEQLTETDLSQRATGTEQTENGEQD